MRDDASDFFREFAALLAQAGWSRQSGLEHIFAQRVYSSTRKLDVDHVRLTCRYSPERSSAFIVAHTHCGSLEWQSEERECESVAEVQGTVLLCVDEAAAYARRLLDVTTRAVAKFRQNQG